MDALKNRLSCSAALCGAAGLAGLASLPFAAARAGLLAGWSVALALTLPSYWTLSWALPRSNRVFFAVFFGGLLFRLSGLAVAAYATFRFGRWPPAVVLVAAVGGLVMLSGIELYFIQREEKGAR